MEDFGKEQSEQLIEQLTRQIQYWGLTLPALIFLQVARPLSFIASQGLLLIQPVLSFLYDGPRITDYAELLADRASIDRLIAQLEESARFDSNGDKEGD
jgi:hypothetical protein